MTPIFILHGWAIEVNNREKWQPLISTLQKFGITATFLPMPGFDEEIPEPWDLNRYISWLNQKLPDNPVILIGHSFGGKLACRFAANFPKRVEKLVLIDSAGIKDNRLQTRIKIRGFLVLSKFGKIITNNNRLKILLYKVAQAHDYFEAPPAMKKTMQNVINDYVTENLPQIAAKTIIIWGKNDSNTPLFMGKTFNNNIKGSQLVVIKNARHSPQFTNSDEVAELIKDFIYE